MSLVCSRGLLSAELALSETKDERVLNDLIAYTEILDRWSNVQRLVGWRKASLLASEGLADAWALLPALDGVPDAAVVDLGAGAGLPGIVLAIGRRGRAIHLVESRRKRAGFLREVVHQLALDNVTIHHGREEDLRGQVAPEAPRLILARAFAPPDVLLETASSWGACACIASLREEQDLNGPQWSVDRTLPGRPRGRSFHVVLFPAATPASD